jgi:hypothetical protein
LFFPQLDRVENIVVLRGSQRICTKTVCIECDAARGEIMLINHHQDIGVLCEPSCRSHRPPCRGGPLIGRQRGWVSSRKARERADVLDAEPQFGDGREEMHRVLLTKKEKKKKKR